MPKNILPLLLLLCAMVARAPAQSYLIVGNAEQKKVFTTNIRSGAVTAFDFSANNTTLTQIAVGDQPEGLDITPDGKEVWVAHRGAGDISVIDAGAKKVIETIKAPGDLYRVRFTPDGKRALITDPQAGELIVIERATRKELKSIPDHLSSARQGRRLPRGEV